LGSTLLHQVAAYGYSLLLGYFASLAQIAEQMALFKSEVEACRRTFDPMSMRIARSLNVAMTAADRE
jgi:hypothetical protein